MYGSGCRSKCFGSCICVLLGNRRNLCILRQGGEAPRDAFRSLKRPPYRKSTSSPGLFISNVSNPPSLFSLFSHFWKYDHDVGYETMSTVSSVILLQSVSVLPLVHIANCLIQHYACNSHTLSLNVPHTRFGTDSGMSVIFAV